MSKPSRVQRQDITPIEEREPRPTPVFLHRWPPVEPGTIAVCVFTPKGMEPGPMAQVCNDIESWLASGQEGLDEADRASILVVPSGTDWERNCAREKNDWFYHVARHYQVYFVLSSNVGKGVGEAVRQVLGRADEVGDGEAALVYYWGGREHEPMLIGSVDIDQQEIRASKWRSGYYLRGVVVAAGAHNGELSDVPLDDEVPF